VNRNFALSSVAALALLSACGNAGEATTQANRSEAGSENRIEAAAMVEPQAVGEADLKVAVSDERVRQFYQNRNWAPAWTSATAPGLVEALRGAGRHGLDPGEFIASVEQASGPAAREAALTGAALELADALADGRANPNDLFTIYTLPRPNFDLVGGLSQAVTQGRAGEWIESLAPSDAEYRALSQAYLRYAKRAAGSEGSTIGSGELIREGDSDPRVQQIAQVLRSNGYLGQGEGRRDPGTQQRYNAELAHAVEEMQQDFGITSDGVVGPETLAVLNTGAEERSRLLAVNMERRRWLERNRPDTRVDVNIAAAALDYYLNGEHRDRRVVVVGQPGWETPQLASPIYRLVANPTWTVPKSIEEEEIQPRGPGYLRRNNMVRRDGWVVQLPGPENALGVVKFDMKNEHAIYLHDTAAEQLFDRNQRHLSHGCIRVENAPEFARMLAREAGVSGEFNQARASGEETFVDLPQNIPVRLLYHTAFVEPSGEVRFRTDPYGWDDRVAEALGYEPRQSPTLQTHISAVGP
jgi:murein L,D-transpeptidase YcbB/YkuD